MTKTHRPKVVAIIGPTGSGKTRLAIELARKFNGEIVGMDASQIYRGFDIGTGKVTAAELGFIQHHNLDVVEPDEHYDAARFSNDSAQLIESITTRGRLPILCGGTGLYFRALREGLCKAPKVPSSVQLEVLDQIERKGVSVVHQMLADVDPQTAARLHPNDRQRIERAMSVFRFTSKPLSQWIAEGSSPALDANWCVLGLRWQMENLKDRIAIRVGEMIDRGWVNEVSEILDRGYDDEVRAFSAIGYRFILEVLEGKISLADAQLEIVRQTQKYAKRQMTWFRREEDVHWIDCPVGLIDVPEHVALFLGE